MTKYRWGVLALVAALGLACTEEPGTTGPTPDASAGEGGPGADAAQADAATDGGVDAGPADAGGQEDSGPPVPSCDGVDCSGLDDACNLGMCDPTTGECVAVATNDGASCDDGNACTFADRCKDGGCYGIDIDCGALDGACAVGLCNPDTGACETVNVPDGVPCNDGIGCTDGDACNAGVCTGMDADCSRLDDACNAGSCNAVTGQCEAVPINEGAVCDDGNACTTGSRCTEGACLGARPAVDCSSLDSGCQHGVCDPATGECTAETLPDGAFCDDGTACTGPDVCNGGTCAGGASCSPDCPTAPLIPSGARLNGEDVSRGTDDLSGSCLWNATGKNIYYALRVPTQYRVLVRVRPTDDTWDPVVRLLHDCEVMSCLASRDSRAEGGEEFLAYDNVDPVDQNLFLAVGSKDDTTGTFDLEVDLEPIPTPPNTDCANAIFVQPGDYLRNQDGRQGGQTLGQNSTCLYGTDRPLYYRVTVQPGETVQVTAHPLTDWSPSVRLMDGCTRLQCLNRPNGGVAAAATRNVFHNPSGLPVDVVVAVGSHYFRNPPLLNEAGFFDLGVETLTTPPPSNRTCETAIPIAGDTMISSQDAVRAAQDMSGCGSVRSVLYYEVTVPAGAGLVVDGDGGNWSPYATMFDGCNDGCTYEAWQGNPLSYLNETDAEETKTLVVGNSSSDSYRDRFDLAVHFEAPPSNAKCDTAAPMTVGETLSGQNTRWGRYCGGSSLYYDVEVPSGQGFQAVVSYDEGGGIPSALVGVTCDGHCPSQEPLPSGDTYYNTSNTAQHVTVRVNAQEDQPFSITAKRLPYDQLFIAPSCDDLSAAPALLTATNTTTAVEPMPFAFALYGVDAPYYWISSNGFLSLVTSGSGYYSSYPGNGYVGPTSPNGVIAPFWEYLKARQTTTYPYDSLSDVRSAVVGTAPNRHLTVQWTSWTLYYDTGADVTFQAKLYESGAIELHYCSMTTTNANTSYIEGSGASVLLESLDGFTGLLIRQYDDPRVDPAVAIRLTPAP